MSDSVGPPAPSILVVQPSGPVQGTVTPPGSKSYTNRALVVAALARGTSVITNVLDADDTRYMVQALSQLGFQVEADFDGSRVVVHGSGGEVPAAEAELYVGNAGTAMRFLTALVSLGRGRYRLDGNERMRERPMGDLLRALRELDVQVRGERGGGNCPPVVVEGSGLCGGRVRLSGSVSSQFLSALLMVAPYASGLVTVEVDGPLVSKGYVDMTLAVMDAFGVPVGRSDHRQFVVDVPQWYRGTDYAVEPDASSASYFFAAAAVTGGRVRVEGLDLSSLQADVHLVDVLGEMGCRVVRGDGSVEVSGGELRGGTWDLNLMSDVVPTLAAVACFADGPTTVTNVAHIRVKETDRIQALTAELRRLGATVEEREDGLTIEPGELHGAEVETYDDHRMAMSLALVGLRVPGVRIKNPACVTKTYPDFFEDLGRISTPVEES